MFNNAQELFDYVARFLIKQQQPSIDPEGGCLYRNELGNKKKVLKCAIGCLIPKRVYTSDMEWRTISGLIHNFGDVIPSYIADNKDFLDELQDAHDGTASSISIPDFLHQIKRNLRDVATKHRLNTGVLHEV